MRVGAVCVCGPGGSYYTLYSHASIYQILALAKVWIEHFKSIEKRIKKNQFPIGYSRRALYLSILYSIIFLSRKCLIREEYTLHWLYRLVLYILVYGFIKYNIFLNFHQFGCISTLRRDISCAPRRHHMTRAALPSPYHCRIVMADINCIASVYSHLFIYHYIHKKYISAGLFAESIQKINFSIFLFIQKQVSTYKYICCCCCCCSYNKMIAYWMFYCKMFGQKGK